MIHQTKTVGLMLYLQDDWGEDSDSGISDTAHDSDDENVEKEKKPEADSEEEEMGMDMEAEALDMEAEAMLFDSMVSPLSTVQVRLTFSSC